MRILLTILLLAAAAAPAAAELAVTTMVVSAGFDRETRSPVDPGDSFAADAGRLWCYTRITGASEPLAVTHVWYHEGETRARIVLPVRSADWRTWSAKDLLPAWTGAWEVKVLDPDGLVLATRSFTVTPVESGEEPND